MSYYRTCPYCGAHLDPGEVCDCFPSRYALLNSEIRQKMDAYIGELLAKQRTAPSAVNTESGKAEQTFTGPDSASIVSHD